MKIRAFGAVFTRVSSILILSAVLGVLAGCASLAPPQVALYDLGPVLRATPAQPDAPRLPLALADVEVPARLESRAIFYRLLYAEPNRLHSYALARWSEPPGQLLAQRLRALLAQRWTVLTAGEGAGLPRGRNQSVYTLHVALEDFGHEFESPQRSLGVVRVRATLVEATPVGDRLVAQRVFAAQQPAASADAAGGATALALALDRALEGLPQWIAQQR